MKSILTIATTATLTVLSGSALGNTTLFNGTDTLFPAHPCSLAVDLDSAGQLASVVLKGDFIGPTVLHIPREEVPSSMADHLTLDSKVNFATAPQSTATDAGVHAIATGPSLWLYEGPSTVTHNLTFSPSMTAPTTVSYQADQHYGRGLDWLGSVTIICQNLQPAR